MTEETTVDPLHLDLDSTEMVIIDNDPGSHATTSKALLDARAFQPNPQVLMETKLQGVLSLTLPANGPVPKEIEMRFVGGAVSKLEDKNEGVFYSYNQSCWKETRSFIAKAFHNAFGDRF